ncbi:FtsX-like permease family protein [Janibacter sp. HTCC2649]|uniref:FtsX-like permease family protein n=1 Tax=Janibacter sp. HTCC2649 TaxID=313589 RepID=UPI0002F86B55|nr:FtsX-like permease family protein [Janibacter sp. HTCC2649]
MRTLKALSLVWRGARTTALATVLFALLTATTTAYLVAAPRLQDTAYDKALGDELRAAGQLQRDISLFLNPRDLGAFVPEVEPEGPGDGLTAPFGLVESSAEGAMGADAGLVDEAVVAAQTEPFAVSPEGGGKLPGPPETVVRVQDRLDEHVTWTSGAAPGKPSETRTLTVGKVTRPVHLLPVGVAQAVATSLGIKVGAAYELFPTGESSQVGREPIFVVIAGTFEPVNRRDPFWDPEGRMLGVASIPSPQGGAVRQGALVMPVESYPALTDSLRRGETPDVAPMGSPLLTHSWRYTVREDLGQADAARVSRMASRLDIDPNMTRLPERVRLTTDIPSLVDRYQRSLASTSVVTSFATAGITALAAIVLMLTALVATASRLRELTLLAARGASTQRVLVMALAGPMAWGVLAAVAAAALTMILVDGVTPLVSWAQVAFVLAAPAVAITMLVLATVRSAVNTRVAATTRRVRSAQRIVAELGLVVLAVLAISTVRARGDVISGGQTDWYAALSPVLLAGAAAVVAFRVLPVPIRVLSRLAGRGRGYVNFLGLARSSRASATAGLPLLALVVGATVITVVATIAATIGEERSVAAYRTVGADVRVDGVRIDDADLAGLRQRPGVTAVAGAYVDRDAQIAGAIVSTGREAQDVTVIGVDPAQFATVLAGSPIAVSRVGAEASEGRIPVRLSAGGSVGDEIELVVRGIHVPVTVTAVDPGLARISSGRLTATALLPLDALQAAVPLAQRNTAYVKASPKGSAALVAAVSDDRAAIGELVTGATSAHSFAAASATRSLPSFVARSYGVAAALAGLLTFLAVLLLLVAGRPERRQLLLRLRTMGMPRRAEARLLAVETLPLLLTAVLVGAAVGVAAPLLVSRAIDLGGYTAGPRPDLTPSWAVGGLAALSAFLLAVLALVVEEIRTRRASLAEHLRAGENA